MWVGLGRMAFGLAGKESLIGLALGLAGRGGVRPNPHAAPVFDTNPVATFIYLSENFFSPFFFNQNCGGLSL